MTAPGADPERAALDARVTAWMREPWVRDDARFEALARELFAFQFARCPPYRRFCERRGATPATLRSWRQIPAVPTGAFKEFALRSFPAERERHVFRTSGTSSLAHGELHLDTLAVYEASLLPSFRLHMLPDLDERGGCMRMRVLAPPPAEAADSSLTHMFDCALRAFGAPGSGFEVASGALRSRGLLAALREAERSAEPILVCGAAFAFVHLLDALAQRDERLTLPPGSRAMETGGFKGRARERSKVELYEQIEERLGIAPERIVNQYGMTELGSQFYDSVLRFPGSLRRKLEPPWTRVRIVDPRTGMDAAPGEAGVIVVVDLANTGSVLAVMTADLGRSEADGFEVVGREPGAESRGCSIAIDEMLQSAS